jgi:hypothetical protein
MRKYARQELWWRYKVAAEALGGSAWELANLPEPDRTFWFHRGLLANDAINTARQEDDIDKAMAPTGPGWRGLGLQ